MERFVIYNETGFPAGILCTLKAKSVEDALFQYAKQKGIKEVAFFDYLYGHGLAWHFAKDEKGFLYLPNDTTVRNDLTPEIAEYKFQDNVRVFFKDNPEFAELYLKYHHYWSSIEEGQSFSLEEWEEELKREHARWQFPEAVLIQIYLTYCTDLVVKPLKQFELNRTIEIG